ncbi:hypothetical protein EMIHUDRAFT_224498 [Emiliania huxleyi CCMP1516]|uniref:Uncharacterized protein n=2 Tax=Emiliania huxleyi TaxID=2903 RepID=A0A0D3KRP8_EMIH1|nr:hypothetical protein EMIHUDRAFT_224498 [Emiliania huxleyi CCMP1516]EOD38433.1 hypothetical protein EMIHUDRAFT_224498 [Emiliania huxleyi CCMP1516]|eukprot:XP_005790862.1 hypothetical protein EMIHUDRAFT_224498 [Emiliania huxleyi CCMP1516]
MITLFLLGTTTALVGPLHRPPLLASPGLAPRGCCVRACAAPAEPSLLRRGASLGGIVLADALLKRGFVRRGVAFPSSLAGSWLPLFFVPNLVLLPLVLRLGAGDAARLALLIGGGAVLSLPACGFAARTALAASESLPERQRLSERLNVGMYEPPASDRGADASEAVAAANAPPRPPFAAALLPRLASAALASGAASALAAQGLGAPAAAEWLRDASLLTTTAGGFVAGSTLVPKRAQKLLHPLLTCTLPMARTGNLLLAMLGPATLSFGFSMQVTAPLAIAISGLVGADPGIACTIVVLTGLAVANFGHNPLDASRRRHVVWVGLALLDAVGVTAPVARGLAMGAAGHGIGTAATAAEPAAFPFAAIAMVLNAVASTVLASIPPVRKALLSAAGLPAA